MELEDFLKEWIIFIKPELDPINKIITGVCNHTESEIRTICKCKMKPVYFFVSSPVMPTLYDEYINVRLTREYFCNILNQMFIFYIGKCENCHTVYLKYVLC